MPKQPTEKQIITYNELRGAFKKIEDYSDDELNATIEVLAAQLPEAYRYLNFIDAYFERRRRRLLAGK